MSKLKHVPAEPFGSCSLEPCTGIPHDGNSDTWPQAIGPHTVRQLADLKRHAADIS